VTLLRQSEVSMAQGNSAPEAAETHDIPRIVRRQKGSRLPGRRRRRQRWRCQQAVDRRHRQTG